MRQGINVLGFLALLLSASTTYADEPVSLNRDELQAIIAGKTHREFLNGRLVRTTYYNANGTFAIVSSAPRNPTWHNGKWTIQRDVSNTDFLCTEAMHGKPCTIYTRMPGGKFLNQSNYTVEVLDGDADHVVQKIAQIQADVAAKEAARQAPPPGDYLTGEEIRTLITGKTTIESRPSDRPGNGVPGISYFLPDGTAYYLQGQGGLRTIWRGKWRIEGNRLCVDGGNWPCAGFRRVAGGQVMKEYGYGIAGSRKIQLMDGDPNNVVATISNSYPYNQPQAATPRQVTPTQRNEPAFMNNTTIR